jgi:hypothetical protein
MTKLEENRIMLRHVTLTALAGLALLLGGGGTMARERALARDQEAAKVTTEAALGEQMNANAVSVITGTPGGTYFRIGADLAFVLRGSTSVSSGRTRWSSFGKTSVLKTSISTSSTLPSCSTTNSMSSPQRQSGMSANLPASALPSM